MNRIARCIIFILLIAGNSSAQPAKKEYNSLLWRISGNGLSTASYVYGTMHLMDRRIFNFSDSLYYFLEHTDGFAAELDMGGLMPEIISAINNKKDDDSLIKDLVKHEWLKPYQKKLEEAIKKNIDDITFRDLGRINSKFKNQFLRSGEMSAIMDVYLYDIARRQGKWVGGIEDFEDQFKPGKREDEIMSMIHDITENKAEINKKLEWMIKTYLNQQLDSIDLTNQLWKGAERDILINRNIKMARRMDSIMQLRTCLFAVGAAHIPGDSGVVKLLRVKGFTVEPVYSSQKIEAGKYAYKSKEIPWINADIKDNWYSLLMPGKAEELALAKDNASLAARLYYDITRMNAYFTFGFPLAPGKIYNKDSIYNSLAQNFAKEAKVISRKNITVNGAPGKEFIFRSDESDMRIQAFIHASAIVLNMMAVYKYDSLFGNDARRFFESFHLLKSAPDPADISWKTYSFPQEAFSIQFPIPYHEQPRDIATDSIWRTHLYIATDNKENISYGMMVMDAKSGYYSNSDSAYFETMKQNVLARFKKDTAEWSKPVSFRGFPSYEFNIKMKYSNESLQLKARMVNRGSRRYYIYSVYEDDETKKPKVDSFLNSFDFLPLEPSAWSYRFSPSKDISLWGPAPLQFQTGEDSSKGTTGYMLYDSVSPVTVLVNKRYLSPYSWWLTDSAFFKQQANLYVGQNDDSLRDYKIIQDGEMPQADFLVVAKDNHNLKKIRLLLNGDTVYSVFAFLPPDLLQTADYARLFNGIKITRIKPTGYHLADKTTRILKDLAEGDSISFANAADALTRALFTKGDLPLLHKALLQPYRDFDTDKFGAHHKLINEVLKIDDGSTLHFIKNNYASLKDSIEKLQYSFLYTLLGLKTKESFDLFGEIISKKLPAGSSAAMLQYSLTDSLALTASIFPVMLRLSGDTTFIKILPKVAAQLLDGGLITTTMMEPYKKNFYAFTEREIKRLQLEAPDYDYTANHLVGFLSHLKEPAAYQLLQRFLSLPAVGIKKNAAIALIRNGQKADIVELEKIARDNYYRIDLYEKLRELKKENLFPVRYCTQRLLAQSDLCQAAGDDYDADSVIFIAEKTVLFRGKQERFYLFKVIYNYEEGETGSYLGITGPYSKISGKIIPRSGVSGVYDEEAYDLKKINEQLKAYLQRQEEYLNKEE